MTVIANELNGVLLIQPDVFKDERGYFYESFNSRKFENIVGSKINFVQDNQSLSNTGVLRGLHFQNPPYAQDKLVRVVKGSVLDVAVDIRVNSPTYGKHFSAILSEENHHQLWIPKGFAHGFVCLEDETIFSYKCSDYYSKESEGSILWNDPELEIEWGIDNPILSKKDLEATSFKDFKTQF